MIVTPGGLASALAAKAATTAFPSYAPFASYKATRGHHDAGRRGCDVAVGGARAGLIQAASHSVASSGGTHAATAGFVDAFLRGMREAGYSEGRDFDIVYRWADGYGERLPKLAEELVALKPDVILAPASGQAVAAKKATNSIPIVTPALADAVHLGLVASEARPQGNVTGTHPTWRGCRPNRWSLRGRSYPAQAGSGSSTTSTIRRARLSGRNCRPPAKPWASPLRGREVRRPDELPSAFQALADQRPDVVIVLQTSMLLSERLKIAGLAASMRLPVVYGYREHVVDGGLISYGVDLRDCFRRSAVYVGKILKGTPPGDLPVEFPPGWN